MDAILARVGTPADLKRLDEDELDRLGEEIRERIKQVVSQHGGHLASNLGVVELTMALHRVFDFATDRLLWDVGHQAYPHKLLTGRDQGFALNRQRGGVSGFPDPRESTYDVAKVGHSSTAISTGVGLAEAYRRQGRKRKVVVVVGDGALTGGMCFEGLINAGELQCPMLVVLNDNGSFIDKPVGSLHNYLDQVRTGTIYSTTRERVLSALKKMPFGGSIERVAEHVEQATLKLVSAGYIFEDLGFRYFGPVDGHDRVAVERMLAKVAKLDGPILLHVHTRKGGGWAPSLEDPTTFHGPKGFDLETGVFHVHKPARATYSDVFGDAMIDLATDHDDVVAVTAAMCSGVKLRAMADRYPDRVYDVGICEQHSFAFVQGLALAGLKPVLAHYSTFAQRGFDQLFQELVVQRDLGVVVVLDRAGLVGEDGETHQGIYDIAWSRILPGTVLLSPKDGAELIAMLRWADDIRRQEGAPAAILIRYPKDEVPERHWGQDRPEPVRLGKAQVLRRGGPLAVWVYGPMLERTWEAVEALGADKERVTLVNARFAKPLDSELLRDLARDHDQVLTIEDHALSGGFGAALLEAVQDLGLDLAVHRAGIRDELVSHASREQQLADQGLDVVGIEARLRRLLGLAAGAIRFPGRVAGS